MPLLSMPFWEGLAPVAPPDQSCLPDLQPPVPRAPCPTPQTWTLTALTINTIGIHHGAKSSSTSGHHSAGSKFSVSSPSASPSNLGKLSHGPDYWTPVKGLQLQGVRVPFFTF